MTWIAPETRSSLLSGSGYAERAAYHMSCPESTVQAVDLSLLATRLRLCPG